MAMTPQYRELLARSSWLETTVPQDVGLSPGLSIYVQNGAPETATDWMRGIEVNAQARVTMFVPDDVQAVALYEHPATGEIAPAMLVDKPQLIVNGHGLLAYTSVCTNQDAGFMMAAWLCAWMPVDEARAMLGVTAVEKAQVKEDSPFTRH